MDTRRAALLLVLFLASPAACRFGPSGHDNDADGDDDGGFGESGFVENYQKNGMMILTAHAVLASLAFVILFPAGSILIRLGSFQSCWIVHGLFQIFTYAVFVAAVGLGLYMAHSLEYMNQQHVIIGLVLLAVLFIQPFLGAIHHAQFKKLGRRTIWSHAHLWLGRLAITLGMINGGLGLQLATKSPVGIPPHRDIIAYSVVAAVVWVIYVASSVYGESRRGKVRGVDRSVKAEAGRHEHLNNWNNGNTF